MVARVNEAVLVDGTVADVRFSPAMDVAYVDIGLENGETFTFEFKNAKKPRADHVKKLRLAKGDEAIAIGALSKGSSLYGFGYDVNVAGSMEKGNFALVSGTVGSVSRGKKTTFLYVKDAEGKVRQVKGESERFVDVDAGDAITVACYVWTTQECTRSRSCLDASATKCGACPKKKKKKRYEALSAPRLL